MYRVIEKKALFLLFPIASLILSNLSLHSDVPLPFPNQAQDHSNFKWKQDAAESALRIGLNNIAVFLYQKLLLESGQNAQQLDSLRLGLVTAQLAEGLFKEAEDTLKRFVDQSNPSFQLRVALLAYHKKVPDDLSKALSLLSVELLPVHERGWFYLLRGISHLVSSDRAKAQQFFDQALEIAVDGPQRTEFLVLIYRTKLQNNFADEILRVTLKSEWERFKGESAGFNFALEYASVLNALNRPKEAIAVIESQLNLITEKNPEKKPDLLLALGLLDQDPNSKKGNQALEQLVERSDNVALAKAGLRILASRFDPTKDNVAYIAFVDSLLTSSSPHPLRENLLLVGAQAALGLGDNEKVELYCSRLMQEFPASPWKIDALRALATTAWRSDPPKYRKAANYLNDIGTAEKELGHDISQTTLLLADCHYLNKDFENASSAYQSVLELQIDPNVRSKALFQYVQSLIELGQLDQAAEYLDKSPFTSTELPSWWRAEWNLIAALKESSGSAKAFQRVQFTLENSGDKLPREALIRLTWLKAQISLDLKEVNETPALVDKVIQLIENSPELDKKKFDQVLAQAMLTKGQAFLRMKEVNESFAVFEEIRVKYPKTNQAALSYLLEANHHSVNNHLAEAQSNLVTLAERFPDSEYAPRALYEASITAERRGLPESLEEAVRLLEHLAKRFPNSDLLFYARLRQGHMLRNLNDFGAALEVYDEILRNEILSQHPHRALSSLSRADCLFAIARTDSSKILEAADRYSDLFISVSLPVDLRVEAGCKRALCLRKANKLESAKAACWEIIRLVVEENESLGNLGGKGRYWASRSILELGDMLERENSSKKAFEVYALIRKYGLPGEALATSRAGRKKD